MELVQSQAGTKTSIFLLESINCAQKPTIIVVILHTLQSYGKQRLERIYINHLHIFTSIFEEYRFENGYFVFLRH